MSYWLGKPRLTASCRVGDFEEEVQWKRFLALASSSIAKVWTVHYKRPSHVGSSLFLWLLLLHVSVNLSQDLPGAMTLVCEILTTNAEGSASRIAYEDFVDLYKYLARVDGRVSDDQVHAVLGYLQSDPV